MYIHTRVCIINIIISSLFCLSVDYTLTTPIAIRVAIVSLWQRRANECLICFVSRMPEKISVSEKKNSAIWKKNFEEEKNYIWGDFSFEGKKNFDRENVFLTKKKDFYEGKKIFDGKNKYFYAGKKHFCIQKKNCVDPSRPP